MFDIFQLQLSSYCSSILELSTLASKVPSKVKEHLIFSLDFFGMDMGMTRDGNTPNGD